MRPGAIEVWNIANLGNNGFFSAILTGAEAGNTMTLVARDGLPQPHPLRVPGWANPPGKRGSLVIQAGQPGMYELRSAGLYTHLARDAQAIERVTVQRLAQEGSGFSDNPTFHREYQRSPFEMVSTSSPVSPRCRRSPAPIALMLGCPP
jgi:hypothetical protein